MHRPTYAHIYIWTYICILTQLHIHECAYTSVKNFIQANVCNPYCRPSRSIVSRIVQHWEDPIRARVRQYLQRVTIYSVSGRVRKYLSCARRRHNFGIKVGGGVLRVVSYPRRHFFIISSMAVTNGPPGGLRISNTSHVIPEPHAYVKFRVWSGGEICI